MYHSCDTYYGFEHCDLFWVYPEDELIDGYLLFRDRTTIATITNVNNRHVHLVEFEDSLFGLPACGETDTFEVVAYKDDPFMGKKSDYSNAISISSEPCYNYAKVTFDYLSTMVLTGDLHGLDTIGRARDEPGDDIEGGLSGSSHPDYKKRMGCNYADLWANDLKIDVGKSDWWYCYWWGDGGLYKISEIWEVETDTVLVPLDKDENLTVGMYVKDWDRWTKDDLQCYGEYLHTFGELQDIAASPEKKHTYIRYFDFRGGGMCAMQYTIEIMPLEIVEAYPP